MRRTAMAGVAMAAVCAAGAPGQAMAASDTCTDPAATTAVDGYVLNSFVRLKAQRDPADPKTTWVCYRAYDRGRDVGGRLDVTGATVSPTLPSVDNQGAACTTTTPNLFPGPRPLADPHVGDPDGPLYVPFLIDAYQGNGEVWACAQGGFVSQRVKVSTNGIVAPKVTPNSDPAGMPLPPQKQGPYGYPSNKCLENHWHVRDVNMRIHDTHIWAYHWPESATRRAICFRVERAGMKPIGFRLWVDTGGAEGITPVIDYESTDTTPCTRDIVGQGNPVPFRVATTPPGMNPASICVEVGTVKRRITVGTSPGTPAPSVGIISDPDSALPVNF